MQYSSNSVGEDYRVDGYGGAGPLPSVAPGGRMEKQRILRIVAVLLQVTALIFAVIGISTLDWYVVKHDITGLERTSHFSTTGRVQTGSVSSTTGLEVTITLDVWTGTASCSGSCDFSTLTATTCNKLKDATTTSARQWEYDTLCPYSQTTLAFVVLGLFLNLLALLTTGLAAVDFLPALPGGILSLLASASYFVAICVFGGGVGARARDGWWGTNAQGMMGYSYILTVSAMFVAGAGGGLALAGAGPARQDELRGVPVRATEWSNAAPSVATTQPQWSTSRVVESTPYTVVQSTPLSYVSASPQRVTTLSPTVIRSSSPTSPRRVPLQIPDVVESYVTANAPFSNQYTTYRSDYA